MAICERRNDRPAALARSAAEDGGLSGLVASRGMPPLGGRGRRSRMSHYGQRSARPASVLWRVIRQQKADMDVGPKPAQGKALAKSHLALRSTAALLSQQTRRP